MRTFILATGLAAVAAFPVLAQTGLSTTTTSATGTNGSTVTTSNSTGNGTTSATGTNGSTVTTSNTTTPNTAGNATTTSSAFAVQTLPPSSSGTGTSSATQGATPANVSTDTTATSNPGSAFRPGGPFSNDSGNRGLGLSPGQTSSGTLAGNSSAGIVNAGEPVVGVGATGTLVPEGNVSIIGTGPTGFAGTAVQQQAAPAAQSQTPLFDQVAREGHAKEQRRRARGEEPRIIGIAPRTDADLSWQMPDDKIIRY